MAVRQDAGGSYSIALAFKNVARLCIPVFPRNFSNCGGNLLSPLLFVALYLCSRMSVSSVGEMWWLAGFARGVYSSGIMSSSKNISLLNAVNWDIGTSMGLESFCFNIFQNCLGLYFRIFGSSNYILALCALQLSLNFA